jgi:hypothetical protein
MQKSFSIQIAEQFSPVFLCFAGYLLFIDFVETEFCFLIQGSLELAM